MVPGPDASAVGPACPGRGRQLWSPQLLGLPGGRCARAWQQTSKSSTRPTSTEGGSLAGHKAKGATRLGPETRARRPPRLSLPPHPRAGFRLPVTAQVTGARTRARSWKGAAQPPENPYRAPAATRGCAYDPGHRVSGSGPGLICDSPLPRHCCRSSMGLSTHDRTSPTRRPEVGVARCPHVRVSVSGPGLICDSPLTRHRCRSEEGGRPLPPDAPYKGARQLF